MQPHILTVSEERDVWVNQEKQLRLSKRISNQGKGDALIFHEEILRIGRTTLAEGNLALHMAVMGLKVEAQGAITIQATRTIREAVNPQTAAILGNHDHQAIRSLLLHFFYKLSQI